MSYRSKSGWLEDDEFRISKSIKNADGFSLARSWQKGYAITRFSARYIKDCYLSAPQAVFKVISYGHGKKHLKVLLDYVATRDNQYVEFVSSDSVLMDGPDDIKEVAEDWSKDFRKKGAVAESSAILPT